MKTAVIGAGIAGLAYAGARMKAGDTVVVYEKEQYYGGLCHSFSVDDFVFDSAVHLSFTEDARVKAVFDCTPCIVHKPLAYNYYKGQWLKHPIINNLYPLSARVKTDMLKSFINREKDREIHNYEDWLLAAYGKEITEKFYNVYTEKYWTMSAKCLNTNWIGKRLNTSDLDKVLYGSYEDRKENDYYAKEMRYPSGGEGYETFLRPLVQNLDICYGQTVTRLDMSKKCIHFCDGKVVYFDRLASSIPLPELVRLTEKVPPEVASAAKRLKATKISLISVGLKSKLIPRHIWEYIYDKEVYAARVNSPSLKSSENVPEGCGSLQFEIYHSPEEVINKKAVMDNTRQFLLQEYCNENDILFMDYRCIPYANVIFYLGMEEDRALVREYYNRFGFCDLIGRFGEWDYLWSDQSFESGYMAALK